jgi:molecular chaperone DnaK
VSALPLVRVRLKYPDEETLVERFAPNVTRGGIFLASREPRAVGSLIRFEVSLLAGTQVLAGEGRVTWVKPFDPAAPARPHGMGVSFTKIDPSCKEMFRRLVERRETSAPPRRPAQPLGVDGTVQAREAAPFSAELVGIAAGALRRAIDRARALAAKVENLEDLLVREPEETATVEQALADLPRYLQTRRGTGGQPRAGTPAVGVTQAEGRNATGSDGNHDASAEAAPNGSAPNGTPTE